MLSAICLKLVLNNIFIIEVPHIFGRVLAYNALKNIQKSMKYNIPTHIG